MSQATQLNIQSDIAAQLNCQRGPVWFSTCNGETMRAQEESSKPQEPCGPLDALPCHLPTAGEREVTRQPNSIGFALLKFAMEGPFLVLLGSKSNVSSGREHQTLLMDNRFPGLTRS
jgi:hypothetical protein